MMKKLILCATIALTTAVSIVSVKAKGNEGDHDKTKTVATSTTDRSSKLRSVDEQIRSVYNRIDFTRSKLNYEVFKKAYTGYVNLKNAGKVSSDKDLLTVIDFSKHSAEHRLWVIDVRSGNVLFNDYVAHGQGSGLDYATEFSNRNSSHQSSLGFYVTGDTYVGKHGRSLRMNGMDQGFNHSALSRAIVIHGANYVSKAFIDGQRRLGRSWGCPAVSQAIAQPLISAIQGGTVLFIYAAQDNYLNSSKWLNRSLDASELARM